MNKRPDEPRSLLRRLLKQADTLTPSAISANTASADSNALPVTLKAPPLLSPVSPLEPTSPIRPPAPEAEPAPAPLAPSKARATQAVPQVLSTPEERLKAETALETLRQKTAQVANEFAAGKINRAQFSSMYAYYNEKRVIIEQLLMRDPATQAWQQVARPGHTTFLRQHFEARVTAFAVYDLGKFEPITAQGSQTIPNSAIQPILQALYIIMRTRKDLKPLARKIADSGHWLAIVPGAFTTGIALFSLEPAMQQLDLVRDLQHDFERANRHALEHGIRQPDQLVFPHRALFEQHPEP